jgi:hypothetical protein
MSSPLLEFDGRAQLIPDQTTGAQFTRTVRVRLIGIHLISQATGVWVCLHAAPYSAGVRQPSAEWRCRRLWSYLKSPMTTRASSRVFQSLRLKHSLRRRRVSPVPPCLERRRRTIRRDQLPIVTPRP